MKNLNLMAMASEITKTTTSKASAKMSISDYLLQELFTKEQRLDKSKLQQIIAVDRIESKFEPSELEKMPEADLRKLMKQELTTVGNGIDTAVCAGKTNASFSFNPKYSEYKLIKHSDKTFSIELA